MKSLTEWRISRICIFCRVGNGLLKSPRQAMLFFSYYLMCLSLFHLLGLFCNHVWFHDISKGGKKKVFPTLLHSLHNTSNPDVDIFLSNANQFYNWHPLIQLYSDTVYPGLVLDAIDWGLDLTRLALFLTPVASNNLSPILLTNQL